MLTKLVCIGCSLLLLLQSSQQIMAIYLYQLNQQSITQAYCINKRAPQLHCNGKCHLKKVLEKTESNKSSNALKKLFKTVYLAPTPITYQLTLLKLVDTIFSNPYSPYSFTFINRLIRPPISLLLFHQCIPMLTFN